jgi:twitching motility two-component system response regulator PilG
MIYVSLEERPEPCADLGSASLSEQPTQLICRSSVQASTRAKKVVVIDDSLTVRTILAVGLAREGFEVETFGDGMAFFRWLATQEASPPDLVLLDVILPTLDGYTIAEHLKTTPLFKETGVLFVSCRDGVFDRLKGRLVGACGYLSKPFRMQEVIALINGALGLPSSRESTRMF